MGLALIRGDDIARRRQAAIDKSRQSGRGSRRHQGPSGRRHLAGALRREQLDTAPLSYYAIMVIVAVLVLLGLTLLGWVLWRWPARTSPRFKGTAGRNTLESGAASRSLSSTINQ